MPVTCADGAPESQPHRDTIVNYFIASASSPPEYYEVEFPLQHT
jgi:hypothetical protein